jgi:hypothetical protein
MRQKAAKHGPPQAVEGEPAAPESGESTGPSDQAEPDEAEQVAAPAAAAPDAIVALERLGATVKRNGDGTAAAVGDAGLEHLTGFGKLTTLHLTRTKVTEEGAEKLRQALPDCEILSGDPDG